MEAENGLGLGPGGWVGGLGVGVGTEKRDSLGGFVGLWEVGSGINVGGSGGEENRLWRGEGDWSEERKPGVPGSGVLAPEVSGVLM